MSDLRMTSVWAQMTARQSGSALVVTSAMYLIPIIDVLQPYFALMIGTLQRKAVADASLLTVLGSGFWNLGLLRDVDYLTPYTRLTSQ
jgi:hypothetical protein